MLLLYRCSGLLLPEIGYRNVSFRPIIKGEVKALQTLLRLQINLLCTLLLLVGLDSVRRGSAEHGKDRPLDLRIFEAFIVSTIIMLITDGVGWLLDGIPGKAARAGLYIANGLYYACHAAPTSLYLLYADFQFNRNPARTRKYLPPLLVLNGIIAIMALVTPFTGMLFGLDTNNAYSRGWGFPIFATLLYSLTALSFIPIAVGRGKASPRVYITLLAYPLPMLAAATAQALVYGLVLVWPVTTVFLLAALMNIQRSRGSTDHLTGTANRRSLDEMLCQLVRSSQSGKKFGGILVDLNDFKAINDRWGHDTGDRALEDAAGILRASVRQDDFVARYGGDEFVLLLPGASPASLDEVVKRIALLSGVRNERDDRPYRLSFSIGSAIFEPETDADARAYLSRLDTAMYKDKLSRKGTGQAGLPSAVTR